MAFTKITAAGIGSTETVTIDGLSVINDASFNGNVSVGGTLTYEDVTNIDSVGLITARAGVVVGSGITLSKDGDGFYTGVVTATTFSGNFTGGTFTGDGSSLTGVASTDNIRTNTNATFLQNVNVVGTGTFGSHVSLGDSDELRFGAGTDLKMYHDGFDSRIHNITGNFLIRNEASSGNIFLRTKTTESAIDCVPDGAVNLYYDGTKKLETASGGVTVTGTVSATAFSGSGAALTGISAGKVLQVVQSTKSDAFSGGQNSYADVTGLTVSITPSATSNKILVIPSFNMSVNNGSFAAYRVKRDSSAIAIGDANSDNIRGTGGIGVDNMDGDGNIYDMTRLILDSPNTTSAVSYKLQVYGDGVVAFVNRHKNPNTGPDFGRFFSTMTAIEIEA